MCRCRGWSFSLLLVLCGVSWLTNNRLRGDYQADQKLFGLLWSVICMGLFFFLGLTANVSLLRFKVCLHQISFLAKWNIFSSMPGQSLLTVYLKYPKWNASRVLFYCGHFDRNENLFPEIMKLSERKHLHTRIFHKNNNSLSKR